MIMRPTFVLLAASIAIPAIALPYLSIQVEEDLGIVPRGQGLAKITDNPSEERNRPTRKSTSNLSKKEREIVNKPIRLAVAEALGYNGISDPISQVGIPEKGIYTYRYYDNNGHYLKGATVRVGRSGKLAVFDDRSEEVYPPPDDGQGPIIRIIVDPTDP